MRYVMQKRWLALVLLCLAPITALAASEHPRGHHQRPTNHRAVQVPESGSALPYLLATGVTCLGAMLFRAHGLAHHE